MERFENYIKYYLLGSLGQFKEWYLMLDAGDKDDFLIFASNSDLLDSDNKIAMFRFLLRSLID